MNFYILTQLAWVITLWLKHYYNHALSFYRKSALLTTILCCPSFPNDPKGQINSAYLDRINFFFLSSSTKFTPPVLREGMI